MIEEMEKEFNITVVLFIFKRADTVLKTIKILKSINAKKIIIVGDCGRDFNEKKIVNDVRKKVVDAIDWDCTVEKKFANTNQGVFKQIGLGACEILKNEGKAIFLEDDNLPEVSFFYYCEYLLGKYENNENILWICGTNYLGEYEPKDGSSYVFTRQLLPCGWASWNNKFNKFYDKNLTFLDSKKEIKRLKSLYISKRLYRQQIHDSKEERYRITHGMQFASWDYHMIMSVLRNGMYGIAPVKNQIRNTGIDVFATHGGNTSRNKMAAKLCGMDSFELKFPLKDPNEISIDKKFEKLISKKRYKPLFKTTIYNFKMFIRRNFFHLKDNQKFWNRKNKF